MPRVEPVFIETAFDRAKLGQLLLPTQIGLAKKL